MNIDLNNLSTWELQAMAQISGFVGKMAAQVLADREAAQELIASINRRVAEENSGNAS
jgi:hypothetical protein